MKVSAAALASVFGFVLVGCGNVDEDVDQKTGALDSVDGQGKPEPPMLGVHHARDAGPSGNAGTSALMVSHGGTIMTDAAVTAIFWGGSWSNPGDKILGVDSFYAGYGGSNYAAASTEYTGTNGQVGTGVSYSGHLVDLSAAPSHAPRVSQIQAEVCKMIANPVANGYYPVYVDAGRRSAGYCAWHSYGSCSGVPVQFAFFFKLDGDPGCDPQDPRAAWSQGMEALANVSAHELSEAMTDPRNGGWYDSGGAENGDKCAWSFGAPSVTFSNGSSWKLQGEWSNAAFSAGTGYPNNSGQAGCLSGL